MNYARRGNNRICFSDRARFSSFVLLPSVRSKTSIPSTLLVGIACFAVYYAVNKLADNNVAVNIIFGFLVNYVILKLGFKANVKSAVFTASCLPAYLRRRNL